MFAKSVPILLLGLALLAAGCARPDHASAGRYDVVLVLRRVEVWDPEFDYERTPAKYGLWLGAHAGSPLYARLQWNDETVTLQGVLTRVSADDWECDLSVTAEGRDSKPYWCCGPVRALLTVGQSHWQLRGSVLDPEYELQLVQPEAE